MGFPTAPVRRGCCFLLALMSYLRRFRGLTTREALKEAATPGVSGNHGKAASHSRAPSFQTSGQTAKLEMPETNSSDSQDRCSFWHFPPSLDERLVFTLVPAWSIAAVACDWRGILEEVMDRPAQASLFLRSACSVVPGAVT